MCFNSFKTTGRASIKLGTTDQHLRLSVTWGMQSHDDITMKRIFFNSHSLAEKRNFFLKQKPAPDLLTFRNFISFEYKITSYLTINCKTCFLVFSKNTGRRNAIESFC